MDMDSFVVRVYRRNFRADTVRDAAARATVVGMVENAAGTERHKFQSIEELWAILSRHSARGTRPA